MTKKMNISELFKVGFEANRKKIEKGHTAVVYQVGEEELEQFLASGNRTDEEIVEFVENSGKLVSENKI